MPRRARPRPGGHCTRDESRRKSYQTSLTIPQGRPFLGYPGIPFWLIYRKTKGNTNHFILGPLQSRPQNVPLVDALKGTHPFNRGPRLNVCTHQDESFLASFDRLAASYRPTVRTRRVYFAASTFFRRGSWAFPERFGSHRLLRRWASATQSGWTPQTNGWHWNVIDTTLQHGQSMIH